MGKKGDLSDFERGMVVGARRAGLSIYREWSEKEKISSVSNTLLNICHEEWRQFWKQKGVQPGTSKVYLIKWPVSVYIYIYIYI